jgi:hypothetical protein
MDPKGRRRERLQLGGHVEAKARSRRTGHLEEHELRSSMASLLAREHLRQPVDDLAGGMALSSRRLLRKILAMSEDPRQGALPSWGLPPRLIVETFNNGRRPWPR